MGHQGGFVPGGRITRLKRLTRQQADIVVLYLRDHPENRHLPATQFVIAALKEKFLQLGWALPRGGGPFVQQFPGG